MSLTLRMCSVGSPFLQLGSTSTAQACSISKLGFQFHPLRFQLNRNSSPTRFLIRAARTESKGVTLGFRAPQFQLPEPLTGKVWTLEDFEAHPALLVMFVCNHCPFVIHLKKRRCQAYKILYEERTCCHCYIFKFCSYTPPGWARIHGRRC
uniref:Glutaredoxin-dependent peroxiredoxin n=1 Tax=Lotus japonicus TaxID=34305 RepID=I3SZQ0_LOTJA|nr:unknown [Lotus japonicus]